MAKKSDDKAKKDAKPAKATKAKTPAKAAAKPAKGKAEAKAPKAAKAEKAKPEPRGPFARVKALAGTKDELVKKLVEPLAIGDEDTDALGARLRTASNAQLLRLQKVVEAVKQKYGSRDKLIDAIGKTLGKAKDNDYLAKLRTFSLPKLLDMARSNERRARA
jgi:hypothetical protein